ncbi:MAG: hypothetical protein K2Z81_14380, partial [Cyanobacteria bacterium]|nr:hypothetical protein [Cyanobacteriota bacterium]
FQFPDGRLEVITKKFTQLHPSATAPFAGISATPADFNTASLDVRKANLVKFIAYLDDDRVDILLGDFTIKSRAQGFYNLGVLDFARAECPQPPKPPKL